MSDTAQARVETFERIVEDADSKQLEKVVRFEDHRFVSIERDTLTSQRYARGHKTLPAACTYLARVIEEGEPMVPESVIDLDTGQQHELDLFVHVAPRSVDAVSPLMPRSAAEFVRKQLDRSEFIQVGRGSVEEGRAWKAASVALERAIDRR